MKKEQWYREGRGEDEGGSTTRLREFERERANRISNRWAMCSNEWTGVKNRTQATVII